LKIKKLAENPPILKHLAFSTTFKPKFYGGQVVQQSREAGAAARVKQVPL
jgi:hypothetical protein